MIIDNEGAKSKSSRSFGFKHLIVNYQLSIINYLALDIGKRRTGVAFVDERTGVPVALRTLTHRTSRELVAEVMRLLEEKHVRELVCGLPLLPSGKEGAQCSYVRSIGNLLEKSGFNVVYLDERYTTPRERTIDADACAACRLLLLFLDRQKK